MTDTTDDAALAAASETLLDVISRRAAAIVLAQIAAGTLTLPATPGSAQPSGATTPAGTAPGTTAPGATAPAAGTGGAVFSIVAAVEAREGQSARFHIRQDGTMAAGDVCSFSLTLGGTAQASDFDRDLITALVQEAARYGDTIGVTALGNRAVVTWKAGGPAYLEVAANCRCYHRRDGDRSITYALGDAAGCSIGTGTASTTLRHLRPAKTGIADFLADYPATLLLDCSPAGTGAAVGTVVSSLSQNGMTLRPVAGDTGPTQTATGLRFDGTQSLVGAVPDAFAAAMRAAVAYQVYAIGTVENGTTRFAPLAALLGDGGSPVGTMGVTDSGTFGWKNDAATRAVGAPAAAAAVYGYGADEMSAVIRVNEDEATAVYADRNMNPKALAVRSVALGYNDPGFGGVHLKGELRAFVVVPAPLDHYERQRFAQFLAAAYGLSGSVNVWPLLADVTGAMPRATYHFAGLTAEPYTLDPKGLSFQNTRGAANRYGSFHVLDQTNGFAFNLNAQEVRDMLAQHDAAPLATRNDDPAGGIELWAQPMPAALQPYSVLKAVNATDDGSYSQPGNDPTGAGTNGAKFMVCHTDTAPIFSQSGGARISEFRASASSHKGLYNACWAGSPTGWPPESDENESGLNADQLPNFGSCNYWWGVEGSSAYPMGTNYGPAYRCSDWPDIPAQLARVYSPDRTRQAMFVNGVCVTGWIAMNDHQKDEPWYAINNTDTTFAGGVIGGITPADDLRDSITLRSVRYLQYAG